MRGFCKDCFRQQEMKPTETKEEVPMWACVECDRWIRAMTNEEAIEYANN